MVMFGVDQANQRRRLFYPVHPVHPVKEPGVLL